MNKWLVDIRDRVMADKPYIVAYYGASTTSQDWNFPNWGEILRYVLRNEVVGGDATEEDWEIKGTKIWWNLHTRNLGLDGSTSRTLLGRVDSLGVSDSDLVVLVDFIINDMFIEAPDPTITQGPRKDYSQVSAEESEENSKQVIDRLLESDTKVVFASPEPGPSGDMYRDRVSYIEISRRISKKYSGNPNFKFVDLNSLVTRSDFPKMYTAISKVGNEDFGYKRGDADPIHYNVYGNALVAKHLLREVFDIDFDPELFLREVRDETKQFPEY